ncbi:MAG: hypothetical protein JSR45_00390 [Proteobacteria bacterium]|nr:hypothetical protein [Pseudomonadota bacterium]
MVEKREKTVSYRKAEWFIPNPASIHLAMCVKDAAATCSTVSDREIPRDSQSLRLASIKDDTEGGFYLHIVVDTPGESASVVPTHKKTSAQELRVSTAPPPTNMDFMDGDAFVYLRRNDVCICTTALTDSTVRYYLSELFRKAKIRQDSTKFELMKVSNLNKIALIHHQGVREIELNSTIYKATADYNRRTGQPLGILSAIAHEMKAVLGIPHDANEDALRVSLTLTVDKRRRGIALGEKRLEELAVATLKNTSDDDDFVIVTKNGQKISRTELFMRSKVKVDGFGKSIDHDKAWKELRVFYDALADAGALEA